MRSFIKLTALTLQSALYYRSALLLNQLSPLVILGGEFLLWSALFHLGNGAPIGSFTRDGMFSYILIAFWINNLLTWASENNLSRDIVSGAIVTRCIRPVSFLSQSLSGMIGGVLPQALVNTVVVVALFVLLSGNVALPTLSMLPLALLSVLFGIFLRMMMVSVTSLLCFYTTSHAGLAWARTALTEFFSGALIPIALFPDWLKTISYCTPFPLMLQTPIALLLGQPLPFSLPLTFALQMGWALLFFVLHQLLYSRIRRNMTFAGG